MPPAEFSAHQNPQRGPGRLTHSAARTDVVLLIRRTVRPRGYACDFDSPPALLDELFEHPAGLFFTGSARCASRALGGFVNAWNAGADPAQDFIRDCADPGGHFISPD